MAPILQTIFSNAFSWMKGFVFRFKFNWFVYIWIQLTITTVCSCNGFGPNRPQTITWTKKEADHWREFIDPSYCLKVSNNIYNTWCQQTFYGIRFWTALLIRSISIQIIISRARIYSYETMLCCMGASLSAIHTHYDSLCYVDNKTIPLQFITCKTIYTCVRFDYYSKGLIEPLPRI